jgi:hypothetical protein
MVRGFRLALLLAACSLPAASAVAYLADEGFLDDIDARSDQGVTEVRLHFTAPVRYIKHFPAERGDLIKLYLQVLTLEGTKEGGPYVYKHTPSIPQIPPFTVMYSTVRTCLTERNPLCIDIAFNKPVRFNIRQGEDGRSILLYVLPDTGQRHPAPAPHREQ